MKSRTLKSIVLVLWFGLAGCLPNKIDINKNGDLIFNLHYGEENSGEYEFIDDSTDLELFLFNLRTKELERLTDNNIDDGWVDISPDGKNGLYLSNEGHDLCLLNLSTKKKTKIYEGKAIWYPLWLDDNNITFVEVEDNILKLINTKNGEIREIVNLSSSESKIAILQPSYKSDGVVGTLVEEEEENELYSASLVFIDLEGKIEILYKFNCDEGGAGFIYPENPYGEILFTTRYKGVENLNIVNRKTKHHKEILSYSSKSILFPQWTNDYEHILLLIGGKDIDLSKELKEGNVGLYIMNRDGKNKDRIVKGDIKYFFQTPNEEIIYTTYSDIYQIDLRGKEKRNLTEEIRFQLQNKE